MNASLALLEETPHKRTLIENVQMSCSAMLPALFRSLTSSLFSFFPPLSILILDFISSVTSFLLFSRHCPSPCLPPPSLSVSAALSASLDVAAPVSVAPPPPPPVVQLTPQIPLTGFVARMQESSK